MKITGDVFRQIFDVQCQQSRLLEKVFNQIFDVQCSQQGQTSNMTFLFNGLNCEQ